MEAPRSCWLRYRGCCFSTALVCWKDLIPAELCLDGSSSRCWSRWFAGCSSRFRFILDNRRQKEREQCESTSLRDDLDKEINQIKYQIKTRSHIMLGFIPPYFGSALWISVVFGVTGISDWALIPIVVVLIIALFFESRCQRRFLEREIVPVLAELETLREKLSH